MAASKVYQEFMPKVDRLTTKNLINASFGPNMVRDQFTFKTWLLLGAAAQSVLFTALKPSHAAMPVFLYTLWTMSKLIYAIILPQPSPHVNYHRTTALLPSPEGEFRSGTSGEKIAVLHLAIKNYSPLGIAGPGAAEMQELGAAIFGDLESPEGREKYGYLGSDAYLQAASPTGGTSNTFMNLIYFRTLEGVHEYATSDLHRKAQDWYNNFTKGSGIQNKHIGVMHEVYEAEPGRWETISLNMEPIGLAKAQVRLDDGREIGTLVDARKGPLASAKGRIS